MEERNYCVTWEMNIFAASPQEAARKAREYQIAPDSTAVVFDVVDEDGETSRVDLLELDEAEDEGKAALDIFTEAALCATFTINDPDAEGPLVSKRGDLLCALAVSGLRKLPFSRALEQSTPQMRRILQLLVANNQFIESVMKVNGLGVDDLIGDSIRFVDKTDPAKLSLLQYQTRSIQSKTGLRAKTVTLDDFQKAVPAGDLSWRLPSGLVLTFLH